MSFVEVRKVQSRERMIIITIIIPLPRLVVVSLLLLGRTTISLTITTTIMIMIMIMIRLLQLILLLFPSAPPLRSFPRPIRETAAPCKTISFRDVMGQGPRSARDPFFPKKASAMSAELTWSGRSIGVPPLLALLDPVRPGPPGV